MIFETDGSVKTETRKTIKELFADFHEEYVSTEMDWGEPVGEEDCEKQKRIKRRIEIEDDRG